MYTTQKEIRSAFWEQFDAIGHYYQSKRQNEQPCDVRVAFCDFVDSLRRDNAISEAMAQKVTL